jgi:23S rRNA pseudouridine1911/1915/1917 synthase
VSDSRAVAHYPVRRGGVRVDRFVADAEDCGRRAARRAIAEGRVRIDGRLARASETVASGATVSVETAVPADSVAAGPDSFDAPRILWEDESILVLSKPSGFHTHSGAREPSLAAWLAERRPHCRDVGERGVECGIAHRLDRDTSGVIVAGVRQSAYDSLRRAFAGREIAKRYLALASGHLREATVVDQALARRRTRVVPARRRDRAWQARTSFRGISGTADWTLLEAQMSTGVTHQVRAHAAIAGVPLFGDEKYGGPPSPAGSRQGVLLHAWSLCLPGGAEFTAPAPPDFLIALAAFRARGSRR